MEYPRLQAFFLKDFENIIYYFLGCKVSAEKSTNSLMGIPVDSLSLRASFLKALVSWCRCTEYQELQLSGLVQAMWYMWGGGLGVWHDHYLWNVDKSSLQKYFFIVNTQNQHMWPESKCHSKTLTTSTTVNSWKARIICRK